MTANGSQDADGPGQGEVPRPRFGLRHSVFWRVASILVGVQVATGLLAVVLSGFFANERSVNLTKNSLRLRIIDLAKEVERGPTDLTEGLSNLTEWQISTLASRFPDPVYVLDIDGSPLRKLEPGTRVGRRVDEIGIPIDWGRLMERDTLIVQIDPDRAGGTWAFAPIYDTDNVIVGGLLVAPLDNSIQSELQETQEAFEDAFGVVVTIAVLIAVLLGAFFTWQLVRPLRSVTRRVEQIGAGDYSSRIERRSQDEFGRLSVAINNMAGAVEQSIEALRTTDRLRRELIANVGHDLRTPLAAMLGYLEEAERFVGEGQHEAAVQALETAGRQGNYLQQLVGDLFEISLLDSATPPLRHEPIPLGELLHDAASAHQASFRKADIQFDVELENGLPVIDGDGVRLLRVCDNLLSNARRHTPAGGAVRLQARTDEENVFIEVHDTGSGMAEDEVDNVFERYYRGQEARTRRMKGTGLGLPISRAIARAHGGDLTAQSVLGEGSTFTMRLPRIIPNGASLTPP